MTGSAVRGAYSSKIHSERLDNFTKFDNHWNLIMCCVFCSGDGDENSSDDDDDYSLSDQEASDSGGDAVSTANLVHYLCVLGPQHKNSLFITYNVISTF